MAFHILCPECSEDLAEISKAYTYCKNIYCSEVLEKYKDDINIDEMDLKSNIFTDIGAILNALGITKMCCVSHMIGETSFDVEY
ncbi:MAG: hypothetical protein ACRCZI_07365 [Cetobacterium sp.]